MFFKGSGITTCLAAVAFIYNKIEVSKSEASGWRSALNIETKDAWGPTLLTLLLSIFSFLSVFSAPKLCTQQSIVLKHFYF